MKAITILIAAILALQVNILFAGNETVTAPGTTDNTLITAAILAPVAPAEATFEEAILINENINLIPVTPSEASFEDISFPMVSAFDLAPVVPVLADFE
jgi:hypothetical protein